MPKRTTKAKRVGPRTEAGILVRLTTDEKREITDAAARDLVPAGVWCRALLLRTARAGRVPASETER